LELMEDIRPPASPGDGDGVLASVNSIRLSVPDLDRAVRFWVDGLGLSEAHGVTLHTEVHETLWGLAGAERKSVLLNGGNILVELVEYWHPRGRNKPAGALLSDQGILNVALGTTDRLVFNDVVARAERAGFRPCHPPWTMPDVATMTYMQDGQGLTVELLAVEPTALQRMGFARGPDA
jgi:catechol 2,3-dioxygenase-like lactoylglutathione lyase family enzyme